MNIEMPEFYNVKDIMKIFGCSQAHAYKIIKSLNDELAAKGKITIRGKVNKKYLHERI